MNYLILKNRLNQCQWYHFTENFHQKLTCLIKSKFDFKEIQLLILNNVNTLQTNSCVFIFLNRSHGSKIGTSFFFFFYKIIWQRTIMFQYWSTYNLNDLIIPSYLQLICLYFILSPLILDRSPFCLSNLCCRSCTLMYIVFSVTETKKRD